MTPALTTPVSTWYLFWASVHSANMLDTTAVLAATDTATTVDTTTTADTAAPAVAATAGSADSHCNLSLWWHDILPRRNYHISSTTPGRVHFKTHTLRGISSPFPPKPRWPTSYHGGIIGHISMRPFHWRIARPRHSPRRGQQYQLENSFAGVSCVLSLPTPQAKFHLDLV